MGDMDQSIALIGAIAVAVFGLIIGSFLNAALWRMRVRRSLVSDRSRCPHCKHVLGPAELIPVFSFFWQRGRCRHCRRKISWWYPGIELATAAVFCVNWFRFGLSTEFFYVTVISAFLIVIFVYDARYSLILDRVSLPGAALAFIGSLLLGVPFWDVLLGALIGGGFFFLQYVISRGRWIGGGDMRLGLLLGAFLAWPEIVFALCLAYILGSLYGIGLVLSKKKSWQSAIPFGTFLSLAAYIFYLMSDRVLPYLT